MVYGMLVIGACLTFVLLMPATRAGFLESFCAVNCNRGMGGNLCRCNGFHFAGKRTMPEDLLKSNQQYFSLDKNSDVPSMDLSPLERKLSLKNERKEDEMVGTDSMDDARHLLEWILRKLKHRQQNQIDYSTFSGLEDELSN